MCNLVHFVDEIRIYGVQDRVVHGNSKSHWNVIPIWLIREMGIKQRKMLINVYTLNYHSIATTEGDFSHPTLGHKTEFQWGDPEFQ